MPHRHPNTAIHGVFFDDHWYAGKPGARPPWDMGGPTEMQLNATADMGLTAAEISAITDGYHQTLSLVQQKIVGLGGFVWQLFSPGSASVSRPPITNSTTGPTACATVLRAQCVEGGGSFSKGAMMYAIRIGKCGKGSGFCDFEQSLASFLVSK